MSMSYKEFKQNLSQIIIDGIYIDDDISSLLKLLSQFDFVEEHELFYPQGIFLGKELKLFFFTKKAITVVETGKSSVVTNYNIEQISNCILTLPDIYSPALCIKFQNGQELNFNSISDSTANRKSATRESVLNIYKFLTSEQ
ncbi:hypothetical protein COE08_21485 [Priestia megaterium]|uniref:hypothetical protein n=1 Tax=Priestia megaterium TaxID=1404 RepID=UPI000BFD6C17|nr:hypothetical protein [Priestia megaterium]PGX17455.1 hypothetical protein COE08_21485 [Priestia megaterium]